MRIAWTGVLFALSLLGCKRDREPEKHVGTASGSSAARDAGPAWYRAVIRANDGVEVHFFLSVPAPGTPGQAILRVGGHDVRTEATFDGKTLEVPFAVHLTSLEGTAGPDGAIAGSFTTTWRAWGASSLPLSATKVAAPATSALATVAAGGAALQLPEPRTVWRLAMSDSGEAKLVVEQSAPGDFTGLLFFDTGNINYLAGNGRGDTLILTGFDGASAYRIELELDAERKQARGKWAGGHRLDWRETLTAARVADFTLALKPKAAAPDAKIGLPDHPELAALAGRPLLVELAGSWCSTCRNAAQFLVEVYREYRPRGLDMVTLLYEFTDEPAIDKQQAETFKKTYGVTWPVIPVRGGLEDFADIIPSGLTDLDPNGFPIALHAGFPASDATEEFRRVAAEYRANIETLLRQAKK